MEGFRTTNIEIQDISNEYVGNMVEYLLDK